ncbi:MAG: right-handed parallel beta-helix repeat-containing protein [Candidatus Heimdallarchaeota archaeon]|nr:right-handed parallel beta-helix repeat-containing protein [Candidatus Heimdallarchaeota archaeon]MCK4955409.1 right-handed parallel beta-helix repeat-containing protein [Candidatus Heimdallarchaeota archaeon]
MKNFKTIILCTLIFNVILLNALIPQAENKQSLLKTTDAFVLEDLNFDLIQSEPIIITRDSDFLIFPGSGTSEDPYRIENYNITTSEYLCGVNITGTSKYFVIQNCLIDAIDVGIWIFYTAEGTVRIINNTCINNNLYGINVRFTSDVVISDNKVFSSGEGGISAIFSDNLLVRNNLCFSSKKNGISLNYIESAIVENNTCFDNKNGLELFNARDTEIRNNLFFNNSENGLISQSDASVIIQANILEKNLNAGLFCKDSDNIRIQANNFSENMIGIHLQGNLKSRIFNNSITKNSGRGIKFDQTNNSIISYNYIKLNTGYGVFVNESNHNVIHHNNFIDNNQGGISQAFSREGVNNTWYEKETEEGNFWSNYIGVGNYLIEGIPYSYDIFPLLEPAIPPLELGSSRNKILISTITSGVILFIGIIGFITIYFPIIKHRRNLKHKMDLAYSKDVGVALFRFGIESDELLIKDDFGSLKINLDEFIGYCYVTIGQGQRYETGVYGPVPSPSLPGHNVIIFSFWGKDDAEGDPRMEDKQYYLLTVIFPEERNDYLIENKTMNERFQTYIKKFEYPNRMSVDEINHFREIVFV